MKKLIKDLEMLTQEIGLRSIEMVDKLPILNLIDEMNISISELSPSPERLVIKGFVDKLEEIVK